MRTNSNSSTKIHGWFSPKAPRLFQAALIVLCLAVLSFSQTPGSLDPTFDGDGMVTTDFGSYEVAKSVAIQTDGKIVAAGYYDSTRFALVRYNTDGSLDTTFGSGGKVITQIGDHSVAHSVAVQTDGKIVAAGFSYNGSYGDFALARYNADGSLDTTFDGDGKVTTPIGASDDIAYSITIQTDGKIVAAGSSYNGQNRDFALVRYNPDGSLDTTFDGDGKVTTDFGPYDEAHSVAIQSDGKLVAAGTGSHSIALARYTIDGSLDASFGSGGIVSTQVVGADAGSLTLQSINGVEKIVTASGGCESSSNCGFVLVRYNANGTLDTTFGGDGKITTDFGPFEDKANAVAIQSDEKIVAAGIMPYAPYSNGFGYYNHFALARYNPDGSLDTSFDGDGKVTTAVKWDGIYNDGANSVTIQTDGKIVAAGLQHLRLWSCPIQPRRLARWSWCAV
jgi:uncharacterized delta-60 repeat protein